MLKPAMLVLALIATQLQAIPVMAQQGIPGGKWWKMPAVAKKLNFSDREIEQLDAAYRESRRRMIRLQADVQTEQLDLQHIIEGRDLDEADALRQYKKLDRARSELGIERFRFLIEVRKIVGHERFSALLQWREKRRERMKPGLSRVPASDE